MAISSLKREVQIRKRRRDLVKGLGAGGEILKCSLIERFTVCSRHGCRCMRGEKHGPYLYVSYFDGKQSRQVYVPQLMEEQVRAWVHNSQRLSEAVAKLSDLSVQLIRLRHEKLQAKSPAERSGRQKGR